MEPPSNLLRPALSVSPYSTSAAAPNTSPPDTASSRSPRALNGWNYPSSAAAAAAAASVAAHDTSPPVVSPPGTCNFPSYGSSLGMAAAASMPGSMHKASAGYSSYPSLSAGNVSDFLPNCQQIMQNQALTPLHTSLNTMQSISASRNFPFYPGDVYQTNNHHAGMATGGLFPDLSIPAIPRFEADMAPSYAGALTDSTHNPGE